MEKLSVRRLLISIQLKVGVEGGYLLNQKSVFRALFQQSRFPSHKRRFSRRSSCPVASCSPRPSETNCWPFQPTKLTYSAFNTHDLAVIRRRRGDHNRLGG